MVFLVLDENATSARGEDYYGKRGNLFGATGDIRDGGLSDFQNARESVDAMIDSCTPNGLFERVHRANMLKTIECPRVEPLNNNDDVTGLYNRILDIYKIDREMLDAKRANAFRNGVASIWPGVFPAGCRTMLDFRRLYIHQSGTVAAREKRLLESIGNYVVSTIDLYGIVSEINNAENTIRSVMTKLNRIEKMIEENESIVKTVSDVVDRARENVMNDIAEWSIHADSVITLYDGMKDFVAELRRSRVLLQAFKLGLVMLENSIRKTHISSKGDLAIHNALQLVSIQEQLLDVYDRIPNLIPKFDINIWERLRAFVQDVIPRFRGEIEFLDLKRILRNIEAVIGMAELPSTIGNNIHSFRETEMSKLRYNIRKTKQVSEFVYISGKHRASASYEIQKHVAKYQTIVLNQVGRELMRRYGL